MAHQQNGDVAEQDQAALDKVELEQFSADPQQIAPFDTATIGWKVRVSGSGADASIRLNGATVAKNGELQVAPQTTATYRLDARAGTRSKQLGQLTISVNLSACTTKTDSLVTKVVAGVIAEKVHERTDGVYLQTNIFGLPNPAVTITDGLMNISLVLGKRIDYFPDPTITISASFGLDVVPGTPPPHMHLAVPLPVGAIVPTVLAPVGKNIKTDVSFPWYAWAVPGAIIGLPIAISGAEADAYRSTDSMIDEIVAELLNSYFAAPANMSKQHVDLFDDQFGGEFAVTFCPTPKPVFE
jgi:hypothetical protein